MNMTPNSPIPETLQHFPSNKYINLNMKNEEMKQKGQSG